MYKSQVDDDWQYSPLYRGQKTDAEDALHPILQCQVINRDRKEEMWSAYSEFKVTKLPRGGTNDSFAFVPKRNLTTHTRRSKKSEEQLHNEQVEAFKKKEAKLVGESFEEKPLDLALG